MGYEIIKDGKTYYPLTPSQMNVLLGEKIGKAISNICVVFHFDSYIDPDVMERAINSALSRMPTAGLRRCDVEDDENPKKKKTLQYFVNEPAVKTERISFDNERKMTKYLEKISKKEFHNGGCDVPLYRTVLIEKPDKKYAAYCNMHHFINDAYGLMMFAKDMLEIYDAMIKGNELPAAPKPVLPAFEAMWDMMYGEKEKKNLEFWDNFWNTHEVPQFATINDCKTDKHCVPGQKYGKLFNIFHTKGAIITRIIKKDLVDKIREYCLNTGISEQIVYHLAFSLFVFLSHPGAKQISMNVTNSMRSKKCTKNTGGSLVIAPRFYIEINQEMTFDEACRHMMNFQITCYKHLCTDTTEAERNLRKNLHGFKILDKGWIHTYGGTLFTYQPFSVGSDTVVKYHMERIGSGISTQPVYLTVISMDNYSGDLSAIYDYYAYTVTPERIDALHSFIVNFLVNAMKNPEKHLIELCK